MINNSARIVLLLCFAGLGVGGCGDQAWNNPYPAAESAQNIFYSAFEERPNHLDPAQSYSSNEIEFTGQVYEPPLEYHYLKRPYTLIPLAAESLPVAQYIDDQGRPLPADAPIERIAYSIYTIKIQQGIRYQPHPAFARDADGKYLYQNLSSQQVAAVNELQDFPQTGSRELEAGDYVYEIKRLAHPKLHSPILGLMSDYIVGLGDYAQRLEKEYASLAAQQGEPAYLNLQDFDFDGVKLIDRYTYQIKVHGKYPQLLYWLAMPFFAPIPPEADRFYTQPGLKEKNISLDWYPVGTGPFMLTVNNPNREMILLRNPNFHGQLYPGEGEAADAAAGLLADAGKPIPFLDQAVYKLEKESIPEWNKFLQGYYDTSGIGNDNFDQTVKIGADGEASLTEDMQAHGIRLVTSIATSISYLGFNMLDDVVGGDSERARKLRQAISIAIDQEELISIFANGRGIAAQGPIPPGIFGYTEGEKGVNPYVYRWQDGKLARRDIADAKRLLAEAGYQNGIDPATRQPLTLYFDSPMAGPGAKPYLDWMLKQFAKLNIQLVFRNTDYNRFQEKMLKGNAQIFRWGWNADYPDPENFLFLLYGPNGKAQFKGENAANYSNPEFDHLFDKMKVMDNGPARQAIIDRMLEIVRRDSPWVWGNHPKAFGLMHQWYSNAKPNLIANNTLKYKKIDPALRALLRAAWNQPVFWPVLAVVGLLALSVVPAWRTFRRRERMAARC